MKTGLKWEENRGRQESESQIQVKESKKSDNRDGKEETHLRGFRRITWTWAPVNLGIRERERS